MTRYDVKNITGSLLPLVAPAACLLWSCGQETPAPAAGTRSPAARQAGPPAPEPSKITDEAIAEQVHQELFLDTSVPIERMEVDVRHGIVTLSGVVPHVLARDRAVSQASTVRGVTAVVDRIEVAVPERSDEAIAADIVETLEADRVVELSEIRLDVENGEADLAGRVDSWAERRIAERQVKLVRGVVDVTNLLTVERDGDARRPDEEVAAEVERRLRMDPYLDSTILEVDVRGGIVHLSGHVGSLSEKRRAVDDARVRGVSFVDVTGLNVSEWMNDPLERDVPESEVSDAEIEETIRMLFAESPWIDARDVDVDADMGAVTLTGSTESLLASRLAVELARDVLGVWKVDDEIAVEPTVQGEDAVIEETVENRLEASPVLDDLPIEVSVEDGEITLEGTVGLTFAKYLAADLAAQVPGARAVHDELVVGTVWDETADDEILGAVRDLWEASYIVDREDLEVDVEDGEATVTGEAGTFHELQAAVDLAFEAGARTVETDVGVGEGPPAAATYVWSEWDYRPHP
jgi:osmotically-inducible protein OsmY